MNTKTMLTCTAIVIAFALVIAPLAVAQDALAGGDNKIKQKIKQKQSNSQSSFVCCGSSAGSGNNNNVQSQSNSGGNTAGQSN